MKNAFLFSIILLVFSFAHGQDVAPQTQFEIEGLKKIMLERIEQVNDLIEQHKYDEAKQALKESLDRVIGINLVYDLEVEKQISLLHDKIDQLQNQSKVKDDEIKGLKNEITGFKNSLETMKSISRNAKDDQTKQIIDIMKENGRQSAEFEKLKSSIADIQKNNEQLTTERNMLLQRIRTDSLDLFKTHESFKTVSEMVGGIYEDSISMLKESLIKFHGPVQFGLSLGYNISFASPTIYQIQKDSSAIRTGNSKLSTGMLSVVMLIPIGKKQTWNFVANLPLTSFNGSIGLFNEAIAFGGGIAWRLPENKNSLLTFIANVTPYKLPIENTLDSKYPYSPGTELSKDNCRCATEQTSSWSFSIGYIVRINSPENYGSFPFSKNKK
ncbi:MAG: hypothetical protein RIB47_05880 [Cyclobacteriaceae bacterium]